MFKYLKTVFIDLYYIIVEIKNNKPKKNDCEILKNMLPLLYRNKKHVWCNIDNGYFMSSLLSHCYPNIC